MARKPPANWVDETMEATKEFGGFAWPSVDATRWALEHLAEKIADRVGAMHGRRKGPRLMRHELLVRCGLVCSDHQSEKR